MPLLTIADPPSRSTRRWFGLSLAMLMLLVGYAVCARQPYVLAAAAACSLGLVVVYYGLPNSQLPVIRTWCWVTRPVAWLAGHLLLGVVFYGVLLPLALCLRLGGHDPLTLRNDSRRTGWVERPPRRPLADYFKQF